MAATATRAKTLSRRSSGQGDGEAVFYQADLSSLADVRQLAEAVLADHTRLDVFISNAGIGSRNEGPARQTSADGHELRFAVNYLSGFLLAHLLLPLLKASAPSRIVNVASLGQHPIDFDDVMITKDYSGSRAYAQSKLSQIMFTIDLAERTEGIRRDGEFAASGHLHEHHHGARRRHHADLDGGAGRRGDPASGRGDDVAGKSGLFFNGMNEAQANPQAYDDAARKRLRALSLELTGLAG